MAEVLTFNSPEIQAALADCGCCGVKVGCCENPLPRTLYATLSDRAGCTGFTGQVITLSYRDAEEDWVGSGTFCGELIELGLHCAVGLDCADFSLKVTSDCSVDPTYAPESCNREPLELVFRINSAAAGCDCCPAGGTWEITITE